MTALRVIALFENAELDMTALEWGKKCLIIEFANKLWESDDVKYRTLPGDDGHLYVTAGVFDECRCSEIESLLPDLMGEFDLDDHHFRQIPLPADAVEKTILYDEGGYLVIRKLVGHAHHVLEGLFIKFEIVN
jgi:hypothetical protein